MKRQGLVSIIITTKNEEDVIQDLLDSIFSQTYKRIEAILIDNYSKDNTLKIAKKYRIKIYSHGFERSSQRNFGAKKSQGSFLFFLDADMRLSSKVVQGCINKISTSKNIGAIIIPEESIAYYFWEKVKAFERSFYNKKGDSITDAARFFSKKAFWKAGGYDETITGPEDWDLPETIRELGYKDSRIFERIYHKERATSLIKLFKKKFYYGLYADRYLKKHNIPIISSKTVYFLRPLFYKNWRRLLSRPLLALGMIIMLVTQTIGGGLGYIVGKIRNSNVYRQ